MIQNDSVIFRRIYRQLSDMENKYCICIFWIKKSVIQDQCQCNSNLFIKKKGDGDRKEKKTEEKETHNKTYILLHIL